MKLLLLPILLMTIAASNFCQIIPLIAPLPATPVVVSTPSPPSPSPPPPPETTYLINWGAEFATGYCAGSGPCSMAQVNNFTWYKPYNSFQATGYADAVGKCMEVLRVQGSNTHTSAWCGCTPCTASASKTANLTNGECVMRIVVSCTSP